MDELHFKTQVDAGVKEPDEGKGVTFEEAKGVCHDGLENKMVSPNNLESLPLYAAKLSTIDFYILSTLYCTTYIREVLREET